MSWLALLGAVVAGVTGVLVLAMTEDLADDEQRMLGGGRRAKAFSRARLRLGALVCFGLAVVFLAIAL